MPNTRIVKNRIKSVTNIKQITRAMQLVSTSKMKRAERRTLDADAYAYGVLEILENLTRSKEGAAHAYWKENGGKKAMFVLVSTDKGFCGGLNVNLFGAMLGEARALRDAGLEVECVTVGRKGRNLAKRAGLKIIGDYSDISDHFQLKDITPITYFIRNAYAAGAYAKVLVIYNQFANTLTQKPVVFQMLPVVGEAFRNITETHARARSLSMRKGSASEAKYLIEPDPSVVFDRLVTHLVEIEIYKAFLENRASEHAARMVAMKNATDRAGELIDGLRLVYNQARQASITKEIAEISSGAAATS